MSEMAHSFRLADHQVSLPMPVLPVIEDVGWWRGEDGSSQEQPYRNAFPRSHCLDDYRALVRFARRLGVRLPLGMVLCDWDRDNSVCRLQGATWEDSPLEQGFRQKLPLEEAAAYLQQHRDCLELALHGLCHEYWEAGHMERSEFHDSKGYMRPAHVVANHLETFNALLSQYGFSEGPRLFIPPALNHSFGNGEDSMQALLYQFGIRFVVTLFSRARRYGPPQHEMLAWEAGVALLNRGEAPVAWDVPASAPGWDFSGPILPLHWGNLIHPDPARSPEVVDAWAELLLEGTAGPDRYLVPDLAACWSQAMVYYLGRLELAGQTLFIDLQGLPQQMLTAAAGFFVKVRGSDGLECRCQGARLTRKSLVRQQHLLQLQPQSARIYIEFGSH